MQKQNKIKYKLHAFFEIKSYKNMIKYKEDKKEDLICKKELRL